MLLGLQLTVSAQAATITVTSTASNRGSFTELQCLPPGSDVDAGPTMTTVTGGATLALAEADGAVTLREAICVANNTPEADVIVLARETYTLTSPDNYWYGPNGLPPIGDDITIEGNGALIERAGSLSLRFFFVSRKTLTDGINVVGGADRARLVLRDLTLRNGRAEGGSGQAGGGGAGMGGAIFSQGVLHLERVTLEGNVAQGGASGTGGFTSSGGGGGMGTSGGATGGGFGPGQFGGALGGSPLYDPAVTAISNAACGGGAGFGLRPGGTANYLNSFVVAGDGGGLGNVGGSSAFACSVSRCSSRGKDGGGGGNSLLGDLPTGNGQGGSFGRSGGTSSRCGGGGGVGAGGAPGELLTGLQGGSGGFGGGGGTRAVFGFGGSQGPAAGGGGGFGGGGGAGDGDPNTNGAGGFGAGDGGFNFGMPSGGGGAGLGGALFNHGGEATAINTTWSGNSALGGSVSSQNQARPGAGYGGAIFNLDGILNIRFSTLSGNIIGRGAAPNSMIPSPAGGSVYNRAQNPAIYDFVSRVTIEASILANSVDNTGAAISDCNHSRHPDAAAPSSQLFSANSNLYETLAVITDSETHSACSQGTAGLVADPQLLALADNGGLAATHAIAAASPALNSAGNCTNPATDQRGTGRPQGATCDRGAFELTFYSVGGTVQGLAGSGLVLRNNGGNNLPISGNGPFTFSTTLGEGSSYAVTAFAQPTGPRQTCTVSNSTGVVGTADITDVLVTCVTNRYSVGGTVSGLAGDGLVLLNNGGDAQAVTSNGAFAFAAQDDGSGYAVTIASQPTNLSQTCTVQNGSGTLAGASISNVTVSCVTNQYSVVGTVSGLAGNGLVLLNNGGDPQAVTSNGAFAFAAQDDGSGYLVTIATQPTNLSQTCTVQNGSGTIAGANITHVAVQCVTNEYTVGGNVSGLAGNGLVLLNNGGDPQAVTSNGAFAFPAQDDGSGYAVTIATQPTNLSQTCTVQNGSGTLAGANITHVAVQCVTNEYTVGGTLSGLNGDQVVLQNNGGDNLVLTTNGSFVFSLQPDGSSYSVSVLTQPVNPGQTCEVTNGAGTLAGANVIDVEVVCTNNQQATTTTISGQSPATSVVGESYVVSVVVRAEYESPLGTVTISEGSASCGPVALVPAVVPESTASCALSSLAAGTRTLTAVYTPESMAFGDSTGLGDHLVNPAATSITVMGPARSRVNQLTRFGAVVEVTAPGGGTPTGTVTLSSGGSSCNVSLPAASAGCDLSWATLGPQQVSASFVSTDGNHLGSGSGTAGNVETLVYALADVSASKTDGESTFGTGDLLVYTVQVRNHGPDEAAQVRIQDLQPAGLTAVHWSCDASGGASCVPTGGNGDLDVTLASLPAGALLNYTYYGTVEGSPEQILNTATLGLPVDMTVEDPNPSDNSASDLNLLESLFANGFEATLVNAPEGSVRLPSGQLANVLDGVARRVFELDDRRGEVARVYARLHLGGVEYALAVRAPDGRWTLGPWRGHAVEPTLRWQAERVGDAWQLSAIELN
jgi:uncharacterized repeat protein (TIGR01451 family)